MATELGTTIAAIVDRYLDIVRDSGDGFSTVVDAIASVLYEQGYVVLTIEYHKRIELQARGK